jgi:tRNA-dihydrouridine synthase
MKEQIVLKLNLANTMTKKPIYILAPMDDVTDTVFRQIIARLGKPTEFFTEFVNVDGLNSPGRANVIKKLKFDKSEKPLIAQIWGRNPENYEKTANDLVAMGFDGVDINMGCPVKTVTKNGCCSALISNRELAKDIILATKKGLNGRLPISVKTRLGQNEIDYTWIEFLLRQNINRLTVHTRTVKEMSKVPAHWEAIKEVVRLRDKIAPFTEIIINGDIKSLEQADMLIKKYELDGAMIGRGIFHNPCLFDRSNKWSEYSRQDKIKLYLEHVQLFQKIWDRSRRIHVLNKFCKIYIEGFNGAKELREELMSIDSYEELVKLLNKSLIQ